MIRRYGGRVAPADIVVQTGFTKSEVTNQLNQLALDTRARLEVKATGEILYCFPDIAWYEVDILKRVFGRSVWLLSRLSYYLTISVFNVLLLWSLLVIVPAALLGSIAAIDIVILRGSGLFMFSFMAMVGVPVYFMYKKGPFFLLREFFRDCQSFVVGPPRTDHVFELDMWRKMGDFIRQHGGVATFEQLSQFTGTDVQNGGRIFPILVRFEGRPEVTESGNIVYTFPSLLISADSKIGTALSIWSEEPLWQFTNISKIRILLVFLYATVNFSAYMAWLWILNPTPHFHWLTLAVYFSLGFSVFFFVYPLLRALIISVLNKRIATRNDYRRNVMALLACPPPGLKQKLEEADEYQKRIVELAREKSIYRTDKDVLEQQFES